MVPVVPTTLSPAAIEQIARETAERVTRELTGQLTKTLSLLEKETTRARKAAAKAAA